MTARARGDHFERECRKALESAGWYVIRSAGSFGAYDLAALKHGRRPALVQCKLDGRMTGHALGLAMDVAHSVGADFILVWRPSRGVTTWAEVTAAGKGYWHP